MKILPQLKGPFSVSDKYTVITLYYWIILSLPLHKPVQVYMGHCLEMPVYQKSKDVVLLRADHNLVSGSDLHCFEPILNPDVSDTYPVLSFEIQNFCILCAALQKKTSGSSVQHFNSNTNSKTAILDDIDEPKPKKQCRAVYSVILYEPKEKHVPFNILIYVCQSCNGAITVRLLDCHACIIIEFILYVSRDEL